MSLMNLKNSIQHTLLFTGLFFIGSVQAIYGQRLLENQISDSLTAIANSYTFVGKVNVSSLQVNTKSSNIFVGANERLSYMPFRPDNVNRIYNAIRSVLGSRCEGYKISCQVENRNIEDLIPNYYRPGNIDQSKQFTVQPLIASLVTNASRPFDILSGLKNRHIALWQSHGKYYNQKQSRWVWQRPRVQQTVEDLYTQSYVLPYLVPMLENAGANVLLPRERDTQLNEVIVDNDSITTSKYKEKNDRKSWIKADGVGFANTKKFYLQGENPFTFGSYRFATAISDLTETSSAEWYPNIPEAGRYAVYVSYKTIDNNSVSDAHYTVYHRGIKTEFLVNQTMNGGTWLYLGYFYFDKGRNNQNKVVLTNYSAEDGKIVTADAVKFGGGMGNMARSSFENNIVSNNKFSDSLFVVQNLAKPIPEISHYPRFAEGARYWLQWAGVPDSVYSRTKGINDYSDDFQSRGFWVNYLIGGSSVSPDTDGLHVPLDMAFAFHTDAGMTPNDSIVGTLGICSVPNSNGKTLFANGISRWASRDLTDIVQNQIVDDIRKKFAPEWSLRNLWNKSYSESRVPEVPTMLLELLSHQNFADMRYGLDPRFRFTVSRSIYKGILKYLSTANNTGYVVQPLPVEQFSCHFVAKNKVELHWLATVDSLEPTAIAEKYILYTKIDDGDFDNGVLVKSNRVTSTIQTGKIYSFKVKAVNAGGESFPSEVLSVCRAAFEKGQVLVVNGFDRLSAPASVVVDSTYAGFHNEIDPGVPYMSDISLVGNQYEFKRSAQWKSDDAPGFGASNADWESKEIAGNTFDYPMIHGKAIKSCGYSFCSTSRKAVENGDVDLTQFKTVDLILGEQKQTFVGNAKNAPEFKTFPLALQQSIQQFCATGGNLLLSGAYVGSDMSTGEKSLPSDKLFLENVLKYKLSTSKATIIGNMKIENSPIRQFKNGEFAYFDQPNSKVYYVSSPDAIEPVEEGSYTICRYAENNLSAGVAFSGKYKTCSFGFPFEAIKTERDRDKLMESILQFFTTQTFVKK
jgi:hypothetical protein